MDYISYARATERNDIVRITDVKNVMEYTLVFVKLQI